MRPNRKRLHRQRAQLDSRLDRLRPILDGALPRGGWIKSVRESLGMPAEQMGQRLGISKQAALKLESNEQQKSVTLASLERAARALGCRLTYAIVPERSLEALLDDQARRAAKEDLARVSHSMALEAQSPPPHLQALQLEEMARELKEKLGAELWKER
jgi:predicted DNA-binding mobile mystery protein A